MGVEVKGAGDGVVIADRGCNDCYNRNSGWGSGWGAVGGALVGGGFGAVTSRMANRKSSASSRTLPKTPRLLASIE